MQPYVFVSSLLHVAIHRHAAASQTGLFEVPGELPSLHDPLECPSKCARLLGDTAKMLAPLAGNIIRNISYGSYRKVDLYLHLHTQRNTMSAQQILTLAGVRSGKTTFSQYEIEGCATPIPDTAGSYSLSLDWAYDGSSKTTYVILLA